MGTIAQIIAGGQMKQRRKETETHSRQIGSE